MEFYCDLHGRMILDALAVLKVLSEEQRGAALALPIDPSTMMMHRANMMMPRPGGHGHDKP